MKLIGIEDLIKKDIPLYYRNEYAAQAQMELLGEDVRIAIEFSVEMKPTGDKVVEVRLGEKIDYPLIPVVKSLKNEILRMERDNELR